MDKFIAAVDQGTTSTRCILFNHSGQIVSSHQLEHEQIYPKPGWVEHDPYEIWERTQVVIKGALRQAKAKAADIAAVGITNQRETTVVWDKLTGEIYYNAIVWQDTRTDKIIAESRERRRSEPLPGTCGLAAGNLLLWSEDPLDPGQCRGRQSCR